MAAFSVLLMFFGPNARRATASGIHPREFNDTSRFSWASFPSLASLTMPRGITGARQSYSVGSTSSTSSNNKGSVSVPFSFS